VHPGSCFFPFQIADFLARVSADGERPGLPFLVADILARVFGLLAMSPLDAISLNKITAHLANFPDQPSFRRYSLSPLHDCENSHFRQSIKSATPFVQTAGTSLAITNTPGMLLSGMSIFGDSRITNLASFFYDVKLSSFHDQR
jgi:hypothetical protein